MAKIRLDFDIINTGNPYYLSLYDTSNWGVIKDKVAIIEIVRPGEDNPLIFTFEKNKLNIFNSNLLEEVCLEEGCDVPDLVMLSDGLYSITLKGSPDKFFKCKLYLKTDSFELELSKLFIKYFSDCKADMKILEKITEIKYLIQGAKSAVRFSNITLANSLWEKATNKLDDLKDCIESN